MSQIRINNFADVGIPADRKHYLVRSNLTDGKAALCSKKISVKMILAGTESYTASGVRYSIRPGQFLLTIPEESYEVEISSSATGCCFYLDSDQIYSLMSEILSDDLAGGYVKAPDLFTLRLPLNGSILGKSLVSVANSHTDADFDTLSLLLAEKIIYLSALKKQLPFEKEKTKKELISRLEVARSFLMEMKNSRVSLAQLENETCLSRYHLIRTFTLAYGAPPLRYHQNLKLDDSIAKIRSGMPITVIAQELGFSSPSSFSRAFRRRHHCSPTDIQKIKQFRNT